MLSAAPRDLLTMPPSWPCLAAAVLLGGCTFPVERFAERHGFDTSTVDGRGYRHVVVSSPLRRPAGRLHVYIDGDGVPWIGGRKPADDPTPRNPLALRLMTADPGNAAYLGRPCYFGHARDAGCDASSWTSGRYSAAVVASMAQAVRTLVAEGGHEEVVLIGFSGGGTIARLMAPEVPGLIGLLTVNANLDVTEWAVGHGYQPLSGSISPADLPDLPPHILHVQAIGTRDSVVPPAVTASYAARHDELVVWTYPDFDHVCCWLEHWSSILQRFGEHLEHRPSLP